MTKLRTLAEAERILERYIPKAHQMTGKDITLERMIPLMRLLGDPHTKLRIVHIAGTSGKTSTSYYIASLLRSAGAKVGLTVSPHVDSVTERVQIGLQPLGESEFCEALERFLAIIEPLDDTPTYYELLIALVYWYFAEAGVDYAVVETGLGGLLDSTNVAVNPDKVCVITDIGLDHVRILGDTIAQIAAQKAGIMHAGNEAFIYMQGKQTVTVMRQTAERVGAHLNEVDETSEATELRADAQLETLPRYQRRNWLLAYRAFRYIQVRDGLKPLGEPERAESMAVGVPGRMETHQLGGKTLIFDGAHNAQKMAAFVASFVSRYPGKQAAVLIGMKKGKEYETVLPLLKPMTSRLIITGFDGVPGLTSGCIDPELLAKQARSHGFAATIEPDHITAYERLRESPEELMVVTGSFYLIGKLRRADTIDI